MAAGIEPERLNSEKIFAGYGAYLAETRDLLEIRNVIRNKKGIFTLRRAGEMTTGINGSDYCPREFSSLALTSSDQLSNRKPHISRSTCHT